MKNQVLFRPTGTLLMASGLLLITCFELLRETLHYPDVLRESPARILALHAPGAVGAVQPLWYGMLLGSLSMVFGVLLLDACLRAWRVAYRPLLTTIGLLAALCNVLGYLRWVFSGAGAGRHLRRPPLPRPPRATRCGWYFRRFTSTWASRWGEHLGFLFLGLWALLLAGGAVPGGGGAALAERGWGAGWCRHAAGLCWKVPAGSPPPPS